MNTARVLSAGIMAVLGCVAWSLVPWRSATAAECRPALLAEWPVRFQHNVPVVEGAINGQPVGILLDTGASSFITRPAALRLGLSLRVDPRRSALGAGGQSQIAVTYVDELRVGNVVNRRVNLDVTGEHDLGWAMALGRDFFENHAIEFDLPNRMVRIQDLGGCEPAQLARWGGDGTVEVPMESRMDSGANVVVPVAINGRAFRAQLDSGASTSIVRTQALTALGITPDTPGVLPGGCRVGIGENRQDAWIGRFESFAIGDERIRNPTLYFGDFTRDHPFPNRSGVPDMLLGADFLHAHRVLIAYRLRKVYFTYVGGTVFPTRASKLCSEAAGAPPAR